MSRFLAAGFGGLVAVAVFRVVFGSIAAQVFSRMPGGAREGGGAMAGFFFVGPVCGIVGMALWGWVVWRLLAIPERTSAVRFPEAAPAGVTASDRLIFEFRSGDGTEEGSGEDYRCDGVHRQKSPSGVGGLPALEGGFENCKRRS